MTKDQGLRWTACDVIVCGLAVGCRVGVVVVTGSAVGDELVGIACGASILVGSTVGDELVGIGTVGLDGAATAGAVGPMIGAGVGVLLLVSNAYTCPWMVPVYNVEPSTTSPEARDSLFKPNSHSISVYERMLDGCTGYIVVCAGSVTLYSYLPFRPRFSA